MQNRPNEPKWRDAEEALRQASKNNIYRFLRWRLQLERGKDCRYIRVSTKLVHLISIEKTSAVNYNQKLTKIVIKDEDGSEIRRVIIPPNLPILATGFATPFVTLFLVPSTTN